jgi:hypothetical protein
MADLVPAIPNIAPLYSPKGSLDELSITFVDFWFLAHCFVDDLGLALFERRCILCTKAAGRGPIPKPPPLAALKGSQTGSYLIRCLRRDLVYVDSMKRSLGRTPPVEERGSAAGSLLSSHHPTYTYLGLRVCRPSPGKIVHWPISTSVPEMQPVEKWFFARRGTRNPSIRDGEMKSGRIGGRMAARTFRKCDSGKKRQKDAEVAQKMRRVTQKRKMLEMKRLSSSLRRSLQCRAGSTIGGEGP